MSALMRSGWDLEFLSLTHNNTRPAMARSGVGGGEKGV
jgi:hypothetical protein